MSEVKRCAAGRLWVVLALLLSLDIAAQGASDLQATVVPLVSRPRTGAPFPVEVRLRLARIPVLEGCLEVEIRDGQASLCTYRSAEMALAIGDKAVRLLMPALPQTYGENLEVVCRFVAGERRFEMPSQFLFLQRWDQRSLVLAVCAAPGASQQGSRDLEQRLRLDPHVTDSAERQWRTAVARMGPADLPVQPLAYCAYDVVALGIGGAEVVLRERQAAALRAWVEAGGSAILFVENRVSSEQVEFLNVLAGTNAVFGVDGEGYLTPSGFTRLRSGIGRVVVAGRMALEKTPVDSNEWRQILKFLWKLRWSSSLTGNGLQMDYRPIRGGSDDERRGFWLRLAESLRPQEVQMVPIPLVIGLLILFVLLIGPVDWWLLGRLKRRRYTWILFPLVTLGITMAMVGLAEGYLGRGNMQRTLTIVDVGNGGRILRSDCYTLTFAGRDQRVVRPIRDALWSPVSLIGASRGGYPGAGDESGTDQPGIIKGTFPSRYEVERHLRQWSLDLMRTLTIGASDTRLPGVRWDVIEDYALRGGDDASPGRLLAGGEWGDAAVYVFQRGSAQRSYPGRGGMLSEDIVRGICVPAPSGMLRWAFQISPTGGAVPEDVVCGDIDDWTTTVAVVVRVGEDQVLFRRCYEQR